MAEPIEANYVPDGDDWAITVTGRGKTLTGSAPGIIAARDRADQLVETLAPDEEHRTVVHLLNGDAVQFTTAYLTARLAKTEPEPEKPADPAGEAKPDEARQPAGPVPSPHPRVEKPTAPTNGTEPGAPKPQPTEPPGDASATDEATTLS